MTGDRPRAALTLGVPLAFFAVRASLAFAEQRDTINPDAIGYLRNALYWTQGRFADAVSGYWSPMLSWCSAPGIALGLDALHTAHAVVAAWGAALVVLAWLAMRRLVGLPPWLQTIAMLFVADATLIWSATAFPDVILATGLMAATVVLWSPAFPERRGLQALAGACGGIAYLGKAYGFPFFLLWAALSIGWRVRDRRRAVAAWAFAMLGFAIVAGPWVAALSWKYGAPTYSAAGAINRAILGPEHRAADALWRPVPGRVTGWETPETRTYRSWSPFESAAALRHQVAYSWSTFREIVGSIARFDALGLSIGLTLLAPFLALALGRDDEARRLAWIAGTVVVYAAPFVLVYFTYRYTAPFLRPLCILACLQAAWTLSRRVPGVPAAAILGGVLFSFAAQVNVPFRAHVVRETGVTPFNDVTVDSKAHRAAAAELRALGVTGPIGSSLYWGGMYVGYFLDAPFVGTPSGPDPEACDAELRAVGARALLVERGWAHAAAFAANPTWRRVTTLTPESGETIDVYVAAGP